jgi:hypothetical protein
MWCISKKVAVILRIQGFRDSRSQVKNSLQLLVVSFQSKNKQQTTSKL